MEEFVKKDFEKLLKHGGLDAHRYMKATDSDVRRVYDRNIEQMPVTVDLYGRYARIVDYSDDGFSEEEVIEIKDIVSRFLYVELANIIFVERKKREGREQHEKQKESCKVEVRENGLSFECELSLYADTGLFFDQVNTRLLVKENSIAKKVLNLFCYTGSFSVYAADGGAESVKSVDLSNVYSEWARRNLVRNGFLDKVKYEVVTMDARSFLEKAIENKEVYDLVILDPPAFSNSHKAEDFDVQKDYLWYLSAVNRILSKNGAAIFSENLIGFRFDKARLEPYYKVREITKEVLAPGFSSKRRQLRVWILEKTATVKEEIKAVRKSKKMSDDLKDESLDRLTLVSDDFGKEEKSEKRSEPRKFDFEDRKSSDRGERRDFSRRGDRRDTHSRDHERRRNRFEDGDRRYSSRDGRRESDRYSDRDRDFSRRDSFSRDDRRRDDFAPRRFERDRDYQGRDDRRSYSSDRYERRDYRERGDRRSSYSDRDGDRGERRSFSSDRDDRRGYRDGARRSGNFRSRRNDGDNDTSRFYREDRGERRSFSHDDEPRKKTSKPKPYGYDSFMETKNREKATAFWLQGQEVVETNEE